MATRVMACAFKDCPDRKEVDSEKVDQAKLVGYGMMVLDVGQEGDVKRYQAWVCPKHTKIITDELEVTEEVANGEG